MPTRASKRKLEGHSLDPDDAVAKPKPTKSAKRSRPRKKKVNTASRLTLNDLPIDILLEIFHLLRPADLVTLAFMSKTMYSIMRTDHCKSAWKEARERIELKPPLEGMSEMEWAWLIFNSYCTACGKERNAVIDFMLRRRLCNRCKNDNVRSAEYFQNDVPVLPNLEDVLRIVVPTFYRYMHGNKIYRSDCYWWRDDVQKMSAKLVVFSQGSDEAPRRAEFIASQREIRATRLEEATNMTAVYNRWLIGVYRPMEVAEDLNYLESQKSR